MCGCSTCGSALVALVFLCFRPVCRFLCFVGVALRLVSVGCPVFPAGGLLWCRFPLVANPSVAVWVVTPLCLVFDVPSRCWVSPVGSSRVCVVWCGLWLASPSWLLLVLVSRWFLPVGPLACCVWRLFLLGCGPRVPSSSWRCLVLSTLVWDLALLSL